MSRPGLPPRTPLVVLIHGAGHTSEVWATTRGAMRSPTLAVDLPGRASRPAPLAHQTAASAIRSVVDDIAAATSGPVVLVGHSVAGTLLPGITAHLRAQVRHLVFVAGINAPHGVRPVEVFMPGRSHTVPERLAELRRTHGSRPLEEIAPRHAMGVDSLTLSADPMDWDGVDPALPRTFVRCLRDPIQDRDLQARFIASSGAARVIDLDSGHTPAVEAPFELAAILDEIALG